MYPRVCQLLFVSKWPWFPPYQHQILPCDDPEDGHVRISDQKMMQAELPGERRRQCGERSCGIGWPVR